MLCPSTRLLRLSALATTLAICPWAFAQESQDARAVSAFVIRHEKGKHIDVRYEGRPVLRVMVGHDVSTKQAAHRTYKVYAHVMDLSDPAGKRRLTKGAGHQFTHHRGIFVGWSKAKIEGVGSVDTWHMKGNRQHFTKILTQACRAGQATLTIGVDWQTDAGKLLLQEERSFVVHRPGADGGVILDVVSKITATAGKTELRGDPEHAGVQFRAHEAVAKNKSARYVFPGEAAPKKRQFKDLPWALMACQIGERWFHVQHMSHPTLPKGNVYSAYRNYGRFGAYFQKVLPKGAAATFPVRLYVSPGELPEDAVAACRRRYADYVGRKR